MDLLGFGDSAQDALLATFREVMSLEVDDAVSFDLKGLRMEVIREEFKDGGSRLRTTARLAGPRIPISVDIGFGDAVKPGVDDIDLPVLLDMPSPHLRAQPIKTVIAGKFHAMVSLGRASSRQRDYDDVCMLTSPFELEPQQRPRFSVATFNRRNKVIPPQVPDGPSDAFASDPGKQRLWDALARNLSGPVPELRLVAPDLRKRLVS